MPFPPQAFTINGGCNCKAVRYRISVPPLADRPVATAYCTPGAEISTRVPFTAIDHCNDCRRGTSAVLPMGLVTIADTVQVSLHKRIEGERVAIGPLGDGDDDDDDDVWMPAYDIITKEKFVDRDTYLGRYKSTLKRNRWFCIRCGTPIAYSADEEVYVNLGSPVMLDFWLGTVDREDLEQEWMKPDRMVWCEKGVPWVRQLSSKGAGGVPEHPLNKFDKLIGDDVSV